MPGHPDRSEPSLYQPGSLPPAGPWSSHSWFPVSAPQDPLQQPASGSRTPHPAGYCDRLTAVTLADSALESLRATSGIALLPADTWAQALVWWSEGNRDKHNHVAVQHLSCIPFADLWDYCGHAIHKLARQACLKSHGPGSCLCYLDTQESSPPQRHSGVLTFLLRPCMAVVLALP